jgi:two-component system phosphate regulon response regulator OmpR
VGVAEQPTVIVVDDAPDIREMLEDYLGRQGLEVRGAADGAELDRRLAERPAQLLVLDLDGHRLLAGDGSEVPLTAMEFDLLETVARHPGQVMSRDRISALAHNRPWHPLDRSIDIRITRLRQKIEPDPDRPSVIRTVRGEGYVFEPAGA